MPNPSQALRQFIDDELMRLPTTVDQVVDATLAALPHAAPPTDRQQRAAIGDLMSKLADQRVRFAQRFVESVTEAINGDATGGDGPVGERRPTGASGWASLSLMDEYAVASDIEVSRAVDRIEATAEAELRELVAYCAALAGDADVIVDLNPFRPATYANALWAAAGVLPLPSALQVLLVRHAAQPLADVVRRAYSRACDQLASRGLEPASYRTVIRHDGRTVAHDPDDWDVPAPNLVQLRRSLPPPRPVAPAASEPAPRDPTSTLVRRLFDAMLSDHRVPTDVRAFVSQVYPLALRMVAADEAMLENHEHPLWRFVDLVVHLADLQPENHPRRLELLSLARSLLDPLLKARQPTVEPLQSALLRLVRVDADWLAERTARLQVDIATLQALEARLQNEALSLATDAGPLDSCQIDTVPADILEAPRAARADVPDPSAWLASLRAGDWVRVGLRGHWVRAQVLWIGTYGDTYLLGREQTTGTMAMRRSALERLFAERMLTPYRVRSLLRSAAMSLVRRTSQAA